MGFLQKVAIIASYGLDKINTEYEIPFLAGYSNDGRTIYIDKRLPRWFTLKNGKAIDVHKYLAVHERTEKILLGDGIFLTHQMEDFNDWYKQKYGLSLDLDEHADGYKYEYAHQLATAKEREAVEDDDIDWDEYQNYMLKMVKKLKEFSGKLPKDLDLTPEKDTQDYYRYHKIKKLQGRE